MTLPRQVLPGKYLFLTRSCSQRLFLLRPDDETNNAFVYCLAEAAQRFEIELLAAQQMSNHHHTVMFDRYGRVVEFMAHFHKMLAKCQNALRGRWENMWSSEQPCVVELVEPSDIIDKIIYVATNPVLDQLVDRVDHWPGAKLVRSMLLQEPLEAYRPAHFFRSNGRMPEKVSLQFTIPAELGETADVIAHLRTRIAEVEAEEARKRLQKGTRVLGRSRVLKQRWSDSPNTLEPRRNLRPRIAARSQWARIEAINRNSEFLSAYREARAAWLKGTPIPFPPGTYWLARYSDVPVLNFEN